MNPSRVHVDLAVVGGGIIGAWCARLARCSPTPPSVVVVERSQAGAGATRHSGGHLHRHGLDPTMRARARRSSDLLARARAEIAGLPIHDCGLVGIVHRDQADEVLAGYWDDGVRVVDTGSEPIAGADGVTTTDDQVVIVGARSGFGDAGRIAQMIVADVAAQPGVQLWDGASVEALSRGGGDTTLTLADGRAVTADRVIWATGPWMVSPPPGLFELDRPPVRVKNVVALHVDRPAAPDDRILYLFDDDSYLMPRPDLGHWIFSFPSDEWGHPPGAPGVRIREQDRAKALGIITRYRRDWGADCVGGRVFCDAYTADGAPLVAASAIDGVVVAGGGSGYGFRLAPAIAAEALAMLGVDVEG